MTLESLDNDLFTPSTTAPNDSAKFVGGPFQQTFVFVVRDGVAVCEPDFE